MSEFEQLFKNNCSKEVKKYELERQEILKRDYGLSGAINK